MNINAQTADYELIYVIVIIPRAGRLCKRQNSTI